MLVRASVHTCGLVPGQTAEVNGNDPAVRASIVAGYLERVDEVEEYDAPAEPEPAPVQDDAEGDESQDD